MSQIHAVLPSFYCPYGVGVTGQLGHSHLAHLSNEWMNDISRCLQYNVTIVEIEMGTLNIFRPKLISCVLRSEASYLKLYNST